jgi:hypothetical protein
MSIAAILYDAAGKDGVVELTKEVVGSVQERQLLCFDVCEFEECEIRKLAGFISLFACR